MASWGNPPWTDRTRPRVAAHLVPGETAAVEVPGPYPFLGEVVWLTQEQGGRESGVPPRLPGTDYAHVAHVPPATVENGSASFVLRGWDPARWQSAAEGRWLLAENRGVHRIVPGSVVIVTEGARAVAQFTVHHVVAE